MACALGSSTKAGGRDHLDLSIVDKDAAVYVEANAKFSEHDAIIIIPAVLRNIFDFYLGSSSPGGSRGRVRTAIFLRTSRV